MSHIPPILNSPEVKAALFEYGYKFCAYTGKLLPINQFSKEAAKPDGLNAYSKEGLKLYNTRREHNQKLEEEITRLQSQLVE